MRFSPAYTLRLSGSTVTAPPDARLILFYPRCTSTNDLALELAEEGLAGGTVLVADYQTRGRGRGRNRWVSLRARNLLFTVVLRPVASAARLAGVTLAACRALRAALLRLAPGDYSIKRPNDLLLRGRKLAGILTESRVKAHRVEYCVVGCGLNVNARPRELPGRATSLYASFGREFDRERVLGEVLREMDHAFGALYGSS